MSDDLGLADHQLVSFAPHHLDQDGELQFAAAHDLEGIRGAGLFDSERNVGQQFFFADVRADCARSHTALRARRTASVLIVNSIAMVGSSMAMCGSGGGILGIW